MASITKKSEGKYMIRVSKGTGPNRTVINKVFRGRLADAKTHARDLETMLDSGKVPQTSLTFTEYFELWLRAITPTLAPRTVDGYDGYIRRYAVPRIGKFKLGDIRNHHIQAVYIDVGVTLSSTTVRNLHANLNACFAWAVRHHYISENPCKYTDRPAKVRPDIIVMDDAEAAAFVQKCREMPNGVIFEFALETGMRPEEYLALRWRDITGREVSVAQAVQYRQKGGGFYFKDIKTQKGRRRISITEGLRSLVADHRRRQLENRLKLKVTWSDLDLVFPNTIGNPFPLNNLSLRYFRPIVTAAGITRPLTLYSLRHSCATLLLMHGTNAKVVADRLGHASVVMTLDTYSHVLPHIQDAATDVMGNILNARSK